MAKDGGTRDVDRLFQLPLSEFTSARNELAKQATTPGVRDAIRALQKPSVPAWAVNQLYWKQRRVFDRVVEAARRVRVEHGRQLGGKAADVTAAERAHQETLKAAADEIRGLLREAGEADSPSTMNAVVETLQALLGRDDHGRLVKPLKPLGFEALTGLVPRGGATIARLAEVRPAPAPAPTAKGKQDVRSDPAARKREQQVRRQAAAAAERAVREAQAAERAARAEHARVEMQLARVQRERRELQERVDSLTSRRDALTVELDQRRRDVERAVAAREGAEARVPTS